MDSTAPIIAAVESVIAVTVPTAALSETLDNYVSQNPIWKHTSSIRELLDAADAVTGSLNQLVGILDDEIDDVEDSKPRQLSDKAVEFIKERADQALVLFWRTENVLMKRREPRNFEERLVERLVGFNDEVKEKKKGSLERLDSMGLLIRLEDLKWLDVASKIDGFSKMLRKVQLNLALVFQVVSIRARSKNTQWPLKSEEVRMLNKIYSKATATAAQVDLSGISERLDAVKHRRGGRVRGRLYEDRTRSRRRDYSSSRSRSSSRSLSPIPPPPGNRFHPSSRIEGVTFDIAPVDGVEEQPKSLSTQSTSGVKVEFEEKQAEAKDEMNEKPSDSKVDDSVAATSELPAYEKCQPEKPLANSASGAATKASDIVRYPASKPSLSLDGQLKLGSPSLLGRIKSVFKNSHPAEASKPTGDDKSHLLAYVIKHDSRFQIPIAGDFPIAETENRETDWWKTFAFLSDRELLILEKLMEPNRGVDLQMGTWSKSVVHLERIEESSMKFWTPMNSALLVVIHAKLQKDEKEALGNTYQYRPHENISSSAPITATSAIAVSSAPHPLPPAVPQAGPPPPPPPPGGPKSTFGPGPFARPPPPPGFRRPQVSSTKILEIAPRPIMDLKACRELLTTFSMFTIHKQSYSSYGVYNTTVELSWESVAVVEERIPAGQIKKQIKKLSTSWVSKSVLEKKLGLERTQQQQISNLLDDLQTKERDSNFVWELEQLDTRYKRMKLLAIVVYIKRSPREHLNPIELHQNISMNMARMREDQIARAAQAALPINHSCPPPPPPPPPPGGRVSAGFVPVNKSEGFFPVSAPSKQKSRLRSYRSSSSVDSYDTESTYYTSSDSDGAVMIERCRRRNGRGRDDSGSDEKVDVIQELLALWTVAPIEKTGDGNKDQKADMEGSSEKPLAESQSYVDLVSALEKAKETRTSIGSQSYVDLVTALGKTEKKLAKETGEQASVKDTGIAAQTQAGKNDDATSKDDDKRAEMQLSWLDREYAKKVVAATRLPAKRRYRSPHSRRSRYERRSHLDSSDSGW